MTDDAGGARTDDGTAPARPPGTGTAAGTGPAEHPALWDRLVRLEQRVLGPGPVGTGRVRPPAWLRRTAGESRLPVSLAILALIGMQLLAPRELVPRTWYLLPALEFALFLLLVAANPTRITRESAAIRAAGLLLVGAASVAVAWSAARLVYLLAAGQAGDNAMPLLIRGGAIWLTNVLVFALWYWELDRGGPAARANARKPRPDFLFSQMTAPPELVDPDWEPGFVDYLYLSFTNATAFSPTDTLPMSRWAKLAMMFQSGISLVTVALVVARAVNIFR